MTISKIREIIILFLIRACPVR